MKNAKDNFLGEIICMKRYVLNYYENCEDITKKDIELLDEGLSFFIFNFMVALDGYSTLTENFEISIIETLSSDNVLYSTDVTLHDRFMELEEELYNENT